MLLEGQKFEFEDFLLDAKEQILRRSGKPLPITPKAFRLLLVLIENQGHLVEKDKLMNAVWADSFVEEANLAFTIGLLRKALDDNAQSPRFIETVPKRGYRFIAEVKCVEAREPKKELIDNSPPSNREVFSAPKKLRRAEETENQASATVVALADWRGGATSQNYEPESSAAAISDEKSNRKIYAIAIAALLAATVILGFYFFSPKNAPIVGKKSIAVLPLKPINTVHRDEIYEIGIADSLILRLSSMRELVVRPLSATRKYGDIGQDPLEAGREQQVDYVLASNYQLADGKIRITAQLFDVASGQIEETYKSEKDAGNVFAMQDVIADEVANIFQSRFATTSSSSAAAARGTTDEEAYRLYLQGMYLYDKRSLADARKAVEVFEQAVRLDPNYARAWAGKAHVHRSIGNYRSANTHEEYQKSIEAINKALALNENLSEAHSALCDNKMYYEYDFDGAERACRRALELDPNSSLAHQIYSRFLNSRGRHDEAIAESKLAIDLEPASLLNQRVYGTCLYFARRYDEAATQLKRVIDMDKNFSNAYTWLIFTLTVQGNESEAFEWWMKYLALQNADEETVRAFQTAYQKFGWEGIMLERAKRFDNGEEAFFQGAAYNAQVGKNDKAFEYLEKSYQRRELWMANLQVDPRLDSLRGDPRFEELLRRVRPD